MSVPFKVSHRRAPAFLLALALGTAGCSDKPEGPPDSVSGKVLLNGQPVSGQVFFVGADKKQYLSPIGTDGSYQVTSVPRGEVQILVKGMGAAPTPGGKGGAKKVDPGLGTGGGNQPPKKYGLPGNGLKVTVTGGHQTHDLTLQP